MKWINVLHWPIRLTLLPLMLGVGFAWNKWINPGDVNFKDLIREFACPLEDWPLTLYL